MAVWGRVQPGGAREKRLWLIGFLLGGAMLLIDQMSKIACEHYFRLGERVELIAGFFDLTHVRNKGAAWSMFSGQRFLLLAVAMLALAGIIRYFRQLAENLPERYLALALVLSGIVGNSIDRLWRGEVVDFFSLHYRDIYYYPVFNVADICICVGVGIFLLSSLFRHSAPAEKA